MIATSPTNAWAVGIRQVGTSGRTLVLHWNGSTWKVQKSPNPGGTGTNTANVLWAVDASSATNVLAVGDFYNPDASQQQTLVEQWDGQVWKVHKSANSADHYDALLGITMASSSDAWAVGYRQALDNGQVQPRRTLIEHWDGASWSIARSPNPGGSSRENDLYGVAAGSASNVWAVGAYEDSGNAFQPLAAHCC